MPMGIKVGRTVKVREFLRIKCMRNNPVDPPYNEMICNPFHHFQPFIPAISPKRFAHDAPFFFRIQMGCGRSQLCQGIMIEFPIASPCVKRIVMIIHPRNNLAANDINSRKIHILLASEEMAGSVSKAGMGSVIFNGMTQIPDTPPSAPVTDYFRKIFIVQTCNHIHIPATDAVFLSLCRGPQKRKIFTFKSKFPLQPFSPGKNHLRSDSALGAFHITKPGFIGKESLYGFSELFLIMCIMRFIHFLNQNMGCLFHQRIQIIGSGFFPALSCAVHNKNTMCPLRNI